MVSNNLSGAVSLLSLPLPPSNPHPHPTPGSILLRWPCQMRSDGRILKTEQGLLLRSLQPSDSGMYQCTATEKNFKHTLVRLQLVVLSGRTVNHVLVEAGGPAPPPPQPSAWSPSAGQYKDLLTILSQPEMGLINQYCQDYWQLGEGAGGGGAGGGGGAVQEEETPGPNKAKGLKELKEQKKPRNRRHHDEETTPVPGT